MFGKGGRGGILKERGEKDVLVEWGGIDVPPLRMRRGGFLLR